MRGGDDGYGSGAKGMETKPQEANDPQEAAVNRQNEDNENLANANSVQGNQNGGASACAASPDINQSSTGSVKAINVDSPAHDDAAGEYSTGAQVTANQSAANQGTADAALDTPPPMGGGKKRRTKKKSRKSHRKRSHKKSHKKRKARKSSSRRRRK